MSLEWSLELKAAFCRLEWAEQALPAEARKNALDLSIGVITTSKFIGSQLRAAVREARGVARKGHRETCGLLVDTGIFLELIPVHNRARRAGQFIFDGRHVRALQRALTLLSRRIVGTWHAHPVSDARPGPGDIAAAFDGDLMLIIDCSAAKSKLWRIQKGVPRAVRFSLVEV